MFSSLGSSHLSHSLVPGEFAVQGRLFPGDLEAWEWFATEVAGPPEACTRRMVLEEGSLRAEVADEFALGVLMRLTGLDAAIMEVLPPVPSEAPPRVLYVCALSGRGQVYLLVVESIVPVPALT